MDKKKKNSVVPDLSAAETTEREEDLKLVDAEEEDSEKEKEKKVEVDKENTKSKKTDDRKKSGSDTKETSKSKGDAEKTIEEDPGGIWGKLKSFVESFFNSSKSHEVVVNLANCDLSAEELEEMSMLSVFSEKELKILRERFRILAEGMEWVRKESIASLDELCRNPLKHRLVQCFETDGDGYVDFREFVVGFSHLSPRGTREKKLMLAFRIHDYDGDDKISKQDLKNYLLDVTRIERTDEDIKLEKKMEEEEVKSGAQDVAARIEFNKKKIKELRETAKLEKSKVDIALETKYEKRVRLLEKEGILDKVVQHTFEEAATNPEFLSREDFVRIIGHSDFQGKLMVDLCEKVKVVKK